MSNEENKQPNNTVQVQVSWSPEQGIQLQSNTNIISVFGLLVLALETVREKMK